MTLGAMADEAAPAPSELEAEEGTPLAQAPDSYRPNPWYGWQTLVVDTASIPALYLGNKSHDGVPAALGVVGYLVVNPLIHGAHGEGLKGFGSFWLRLALPVVSGAIALEMAADCRDKDTGWDFFLRDCQDRALGYGVLIGQVVAAGIDAALLGYRRADDVASTPPRVMPTLSLAGERTTLGVAGTF